MPPVQFQIDSREKGQTIAAVVKARFGLTWARAKRLVEGRHVKIGGQVEADPARRVRPGIRVEVAAGAVEAKSFKAVGKPRDKKKAPAPAPPKGKAKPKSSRPVLATP